MKKNISLILSLAATALLVAAEPAAKPNTRPALVKIDNFSFTPQTLTVQAGTTVMWVNKDDVPHTVTSTEKKFKSRALDTDQSFTNTFSVRGTYTYYCSVHPHMTGKVVVR